MNGLKWIKLQKYCELSGDTKDAIYAKNRRRIWQRGVHYEKGADGCIYINTEAVSKWLEGQLNSQSLAA